MSRRRVAVTTALVACLATGVSACSGEGERSAATPSTNCVAAAPLVIAVSVHQNVAAPDVPESVRCQVQQAIAHDLPVGVVSIEGQPRTLQSAVVRKVNRANGDVQQANIARYTNEVRTTIKNATAKTAGSDVLGAVARAADMLRSTSSATAGARTMRIVVLDSGLSDTGALNLTTPGMLAAAPARVAETLKSEIPKLAGFEVQLVGFGYSVPPQQPLSVGQRDRVVRLWTTLLGRQHAGATVVAVPNPRTGIAPTTTLATRPVELPTPPQPCRSAVYDDSSPLGFAVASTGFASESDARDFLQGLATWLRGDASRTLDIQGTTSSEGNAAANKKLSARRAVAVKALLIDLEVKPGQITTHGDGYIAQPPDHQGRRLDPAKAARNRAVRFTTSGCA